MEAYQQRVIDERNELEEKINRLRVFIGTGTYIRLDTIDRELLRAQITLMISYSRVLTRRIERFK